VEIERRISTQAGHIRNVRPITIWLHFATIFLFSFVISYLSAAK